MPHRATEFNVPGKHGRRNDTGVRFADVAGIQDMKDDMIATLRTLLGAEDYKRLGCNPPRVSPYVKYVRSDVLSIALATHHSSIFGVHL